jgi:hypothetical protein
MRYINTPDLLFSPCSTEAYASQPPHSFLASGRTPPPPTPPLALRWLVCFTISSYFLERVGGTLKRQLAWLLVCPVFARQRSAGGRTTGFTAWSRILFSASVWELPGRGGLVCEHRVWATPSSIEVNIYRLAKFLTQNITKLFSASKENPPVVST